MDANPYSETYGQERTERILDTEECTTQQPANYVHVYTYCEMNPNGSYTGNCVQVFEDVEPLSPTYGQQMEQVSADGVLCPPDSTESDWQTIDTYCEQIAYQPSGKLGNSGYMVTVQQDMAEYSPTYGQTRENKVQDIVNCTPPDTSDVWVEVRRVCHLENGYQDGTVDIYKVNTNEYSPNYDFGAEVVFNEPDSVNCPASEYAPNWTETSRTCQVDANGYNTGYAIVVETDTNPNSSTYNTTRTSTVEDSANCPYQESSMISWRIINNRGATTDTVTTITLNFNSNFSITASGSLPPVGGTMSGAAIIPASLKSTALTVQSITLGPNQSLPVLYQYSQNPSPYTWTTDGSGTLVVTLWDGDGTGPEWTEVSYTCETVSGYRTGAAIITEEDMNPDSATYGQTRTRTVENDSRCPAQTDGDWVETSWSCQQQNGYNTGYVISVQTDQNPNSSTYNTTRTRLVYDDTRCPVSTTAGWTEISRTCEQVDGYNTGNAIVVEKDMNPNSSTYNQTRTSTVEDLVNCPVTTEPDWVEESYICEQADTTPNWVEQSRTCQKDGNNENTGYAIVVEIDTNPYSPTYNTTRTSTVEDSVNCPAAIPSYDFKLRKTYSGGTNTDVACNSSTTLQQSECSGDFVSAIIGDCVTAINSSAFYQKTTLTSVIVSSSVTNIYNYAFAGCTSLTGVTLLATTPPTLASYRAFSSTNNCPIYVPSGSVSAYQSASGWSNLASRITAIGS